MQYTAVHAVPKINYDMLFEQFMLDYLRERRQKDNFKEAQATKPEYEIPAALRSSQNMAFSNATYGDMPGMGTQLDRNELSAANAIAAAAQSGNALGSIPAVQANLANADRSVYDRNADFRNRNMEMLFNVNSQMAAAQDAKWQIDKFATWKDKYSFGSNMADLAYQRWSNLNKGMSDISMQVAGSMMGLPGGGFFPSSGGNNVGFRDAMGR